MRALRYIDGKLEIADMELPGGGGEARVRVLRSGICNTDIEIARGYAGFNGTIGHEFVGVVEASDEAPELTGKRVVGEINAGCGTCGKCIAGDPRHCAGRTVLGIVGRDGAHAEFLQLPSRNLHLVPDNVSSDEAVFAEPLAAAFGILEQVNVDRDTKVAVVGDGKLGLLCAMSLAHRSPSLVLVGKHRSKMSLAGDVEGVLLTELSQAMIGYFDVVIEASGSESGFASALDLVRPRGTVVLKSTYHGTPTWAASRVVVDEITIVGSRCGPFPPALELLANRSVDVRSLIQETRPLSQGVAAMNDAARKGALKILLDPRH